MNKFMFLSLFLLLVSPPVDKADATGFLSPLTNHLASLVHLSSLSNALQPNESAPRAPGTIKSSPPIHDSDESEQTLLAQKISSMTESASDSAVNRAVEGIGSQVDETATAREKTTKSGNICKLTDEGIVCYDNSESKIATKAPKPGQDGTKGPTQEDPDAALKKLGEGVKTLRSILGQ